MGNTVASTALQFGSAFVLLAVTPYMLQKVGFEAYGLWVLLNRLGRYGSQTDFGLGLSVTRHVAQHSAHGDSFSVRATTTVGTLCWLAFSGIVMLTAYVAGPMFLRGIVLSPELRVQAPTLLLLVVGAWVLGLTLCGTMCATLNGLGYLRMSASLTAAGSIAFAVSAVCLLLNHMGIYGLVVAAYVQIVVTSVGGYIVLRQIHGGLFVDPRRIPRALYSQLLKFGGWVQIGSIAMLLVDDTPAFVLGFMVGVQAVALLDVGTRLARVVRNLSYNFNSAFLPMISAVHAEDGEKRASKVVSTANRFMGIISFASTGFVISTAPLLLQVWLGRGFPHARSVVMIVAVLAFVYLIEGITGVAVTGVRGIGKPWLGSLYSGAYALSVISLSFILTPTLGLRGVAIALVCSTALASSLFFVISSTRAHVKGFGSAIGEWIVRASLATGIATITVVLINAKLDVRALNRPNAVLALAATAIVYALVLATALRAVQFFSQRDFDTVGALLPRRFATLFTANWLRGLLASR